MSLTPPSVSRTTPPAERPHQRAERAPAGDFAALLDLAPAPARTPLARAPERHEASSSAGRDDRAERPDHSSSRSRHSRSGGGRPTAPPGRDAPVSARSQHHGLQDAGADNSAPVPSADAALAPSGRPESSGLPAAVVLPAGAELAPAVAELPVVPTTSEPLAGAHLAGDPLAAVAVAAAGPGAQPAAAAAEAPAAPAPPLTPAVAPKAETMPGTEVAAGLPGADAAMSAETASSAVEAPAEHAAGEPGLTADGEPAATALPTGSGMGAGTGGPRDGESSSRSAGDEAAGPPAGVPAATAPAAPAALQGAGRATDGVPFGPHREVPLERVPRAVAQLLHVASQGGVSHARIALRPVELGGIEIFLQVSPAGLAAQVIADSPEAARMLAQATEDLRRSLAGQNVELVSIDVSTSAEHQQREDLASRGFLADDFTTDGRPAPRRADGGAEQEPDTPELTTPTVLGLPDGLLVDVLA